jgi:hypothetical protein
VRKEKRCGWYLPCFFFLPWSRVFNCLSSDSVTEAKKKFPRLHLVPLGLSMTAVGRGVLERRYAEQHAFDGCNWPIIQPVANLTAPGVQRSVHSDPCRCPLRTGSPYVAPSYKASQAAKWVNRSICEAIRSIMSLLLYRP